MHTWKSRGKRMWEVCMNDLRFLLLCMIEKEQWSLSGLNDDGVICTFPSQFTCLGGSVVTPPSYKVVYTLRSIDTFVFLWI